MNYKKLILAAVAAVGLAACGGGGGDDPGKDLFSTWKNVDNGAVLDLTYLEFSVPAQFDFRLVNGARCFCMVTVLGDQTGGKVALDSCIPAASSMRAQCNAMHQVSDYIKTHNELRLYTTQGMATYR